MFTCLFSSFESQGGREITWELTEYTGIKYDNLLSRLGGTICAMLSRDALYYVFDHS